MFPQLLSVVKDVGDRYFIALRFAYFCFLGVDGTDQAFKDRHRNRNVTETGAKTPSARWSHFVRLITIDHTPTPGQVRSRTFVDAGYFAHLGMVLLSSTATHDSFFFFFFFL